MTHLLLTALTMVAFAANSVLNRMAVGGGYIDPTDFALVRLLAGAAMLMLLLLLRGASVLGPMWWGHGRVVGAASLLLYLFGFSSAYGGLDAGTGALILFGMVQITMFCGALLAAEPVPPRRWLGAGLAFGGLCILLLPGAAAPSLTHAAAMVAAGLGWGIYSLAGRGTRDALAVTAANFTWAVPVALALVLVMPGQGSGTRAMLPGILLAIVSGAAASGLGYALWYRILPGLGAARAAVAQLTVPVITAFAGLLILNEAMSPRFVLASVVVLGGVALASLPRRGG